MKTEYPLVVGEHLMETSEVAKAMGCNTNFIRRLIASGLLPCLRFGRKNKVLYSRFVAFLQEYDGADLYGALKEAESKPKKEKPVLPM